MDILVFPEFQRLGYGTKILSDIKYKNELIRFIRTFDAGVEGIKTTPETIDEIKNNKNNHLYSKVKNCFIGNYSVLV